MIRDYVLFDVVTIGRNIERRDVVAQINNVNESMRYCAGFAATNSGVADAIDGIAFVSNYVVAFEIATGIDVSAMVDDFPTVDVFTVYRRASDKLNRRNYRKPLAITDSSIEIVAELRNDANRLCGYVYRDGYGTEYPIATNKDGAPIVRKYGVVGMWRILAPYVEETLKACANHLHDYNRIHRPMLDKATGWTLELVADDFGLVK